MDVEFKVKNLQEAMELFDPKKVQGAAVSALNQTSNQVRTFASRKIREEFNIPASKVNQFLRVSTRAYGNNLSTVISGNGLGMALSYFGAKQAGVKLSGSRVMYSKRAKKGTSGGRYGGDVTVEVKRGSRKVVTGDPKPFLTKFKSGHIAVVQREGKERKPIKQLLGPGVGGLFGSRIMMENITDFVNETYQPIFLRELKWRLSK